MQLFAALFSLALAATPVLSRLCGTVLTSEQLKAAEANFQANKSEPKPDEIGAARAAVIDIYWHVINKGNTLDQGNVPDTAIRAQIDVLNKDYKGTGISFVLRNTTRTTNADWFSNVYPGIDNPQSAKMKNATHVGDKKTLNIWSVGFETTDGSLILGYSYHAFDVPNIDIFQDGVALLYKTLPGGSQAPFNLGASATHEVGHWLGLYHTFQGGCDGDGDAVDDTPAQEESTFGCPTTAPDSCPKQPGVDDIHNYMDYSDDVCKTGFTPGQIARMKSQIATFRGINV